MRKYPDSVRVRELLKNTSFLLAKLLMRYGSLKLHHASLCSLQCTGSRGLFSEEVEDVEEVKVEMAVEEEEAEIRNCVG